MKKEKEKKPFKFREPDQADVWEQGFGRMWDSMSPEEQQKRIKLMNAEESKLTEEQKLTLKTMSTRQYLLNKVYCQLKELDNQFYSDNEINLEKARDALEGFIVLNLNPVSFPDLEEIFVKLCSETALSVSELRELYSVVRKKTMKVWFGNVDFTEYGWKER